MQSIGVSGVCAEAVAAATCPARVRELGLPAAWLLGIADLVAKEQQRKESIRRRRESVRPDAQQRVEESAEEAPEPELSQDFALEAAITALPEAYRTVILLRYYGGLSCTGIAGQLDMPLGTVTKTLSRAYALLRDSLQRQTVSEVQQ